MKETILLTDGYKLGHHYQYPEGTEMVYSNWTPRSCKYFPEASEGSVVFGIQYLVKEYLIKQFNENFFNLSREQAINEFYNRVNNFVGIDNVGGGTFCGIAEEIRKIKPDASLSIFVTHMVNPRGIENLSKTFDHVWFTNSYKDWKKDWEGQPTPFPKNVTQIDIV